MVFFHNIDILLNLDYNFFYFLELKKILKFFFNLFVFDFYKVFLDFFIYMIFYSSLVNDYLNLNYDISIFRLNSFFIKKNLNLLTFGKLNKKKRFKYLFLLSFN